MKTIILVWELNPETITFYRITVNPDELALLYRINGSLEPTEDHAKVCDMLSSKDDFCQTQGAIHNCIWNDCGIETPFQSSNEMVFYSGFAL